MANKLFLEYAAGLNIQAAVDRLVGHATALVFGMQVLQPASYLLGRPVQFKFARHQLSQPHIVGELATFRTTSSRPRMLLSHCRSVTIIAAITPDFSAHRRGRMAEQPRHRSYR